MPKGMQYLFRVYAHLQDITPSQHVHVCDIDFFRAGLTARETAYICEVKYD